jgi:hypothetical protein
VIAAIEAPLMNVRRAIIFFLPICLDLNEATPLDRAHVEVSSRMSAERGQASSPDERSEIRDIPLECSSATAGVRHSLAVRRSGIARSQRPMDYAGRAEPGYRFAHPGYAYYGECRA